jgi:hypothetical protein
MMDIELEYGQCLLRDLFVFYDDAVIFVGLY